MSPPTLDALEVMASPLKLEQDVQGKVDSFRARIAQEAEDLSGVHLLPSEAVRAGWSGSGALPARPIQNTFGACPRHCAGWPQPGSAASADPVLHQSTSNARQRGAASAKQPASGGADSARKTRDRAAEREMQHPVDVGAAAPPKGGGQQQLWSVYPGRYRGPAVDRGEHSGLLSTPLLHLLQHPGQVGIQDSEIPPGGRLSPHCSRG